MIVAENPFSGVVLLRNLPLKNVSIFMGGFVKRTASETADFQSQLTKSIVLKNSYSTNKFISFLNEVG